MRRSAAAATGGGGRWPAVLPDGRVGSFAGAKDCACGFADEPDRHPRTVARRRESHDQHRTVVAAADVPARRRRRDRLAVPRRHGPRAQRRGARRRAAGAPAGFRLRTQRRDHEPVHAARQRLRLHVHADPAAARAVPRPRGGHLRARVAAGGAAGRRAGRPRARERRVAQRGARQADGGRRSAGRDDDRPDRRGRGGARDAAPVARAGRRRRERARRQLRFRLHLRLHQHALVAHAYDAAPDADRPAYRLRAALRRRRDARAASGAGPDGPQHPRLGDRGRGPLPAAARTRRPHAGRRVPGGHPGPRAAHSAHRDRRRRPRSRCPRPRSAFPTTSTPTSA